MLIISFFFLTLLPSFYIKSLACLRWFGSCQNMPSSFLTVGMPNQEDQFLRSSEVPHLCLMGCLRKESNKMQGLESLVASVLVPFNRLSESCSDSVLLMLHFCLFFFCFVILYIDVLELFLLTKSFVIQRKYIASLFPCQISLHLYGLFCVL